jgi:4-hydroxybenzoate polyprenyltransferase
MHRKRKNCRLDLCNSLGWAEVTLQEPSPAALPDAKPRQFLFLLLPESLHPFLQLARLDRPIGWWLLLLPCWWSSVLASIVSQSSLRWGDLILFFLGSVAMRGAGSTYNDIIDRKIDAKVARTRSRPLPSGRVSVRAAIFFLIVQCGIGLGVLLSFNRFTILLGCSSLFVVALYPFMKRVTSWPQAVLGAAFAWGALLGWAAQFESLAFPPFMLYLGAVFWTIGYDTIYAVQDIADDRLIGVKSTARLFGGRLRLAIGLLYMASVLCIEASLFLSRANLFAQSGLFLFAAHLVWQVLSVDLADPDKAGQLFRSNRDAGLLLFAGLSLQALSQGF